MVCENCGRELLPENKFCTNCGWRVPNETAVVENQTAMAETATPSTSDQKKRKVNKTVLFVGLVAVALVFVAANYSAIRNTMERTFLSPQEYYQWVEKNTAKETAASAASIYANYFLDALKIYDAGTSGEICVELDEAGQDMLSLAGIAGVDLSWLKSVTFSYEGYSKDNVLQMKYGLGLEKKNLISMEMILDMIEESIYFAIPEISKSYMCAEVSDFAGFGYYVDSVEDSKDYMDALKSVCVKLPEKKEIQELVTKYFEIAIENINDVEMKKKKTLKAEGVSQTCTLLKITMDADTLQALVKNVLEQLEDDKDVKRIICELYEGISETDVAVMEEINPEQFDSEEFYAYFQDICSKLNANIEQYLDFDEELEMAIYVDSRGVIRGRSITIHDDRNKYSVELLNPHDGRKIGYKAALTMLNQEFAFAGSGKETGGKVNGDFSVKYNGTALVDVTAKKFDIDKLSKGYLNGEFTIKAASGIGRVISITEWLSRIADLQVTTRVAMSKNNTKLSVSVGEDEDKWGTVSASVKRESGKKVSIPSNNRTISVEDEEGISEYWDTVNLDTVINTLDKLYVPSAVTDFAEQLADLDGDDFVDQMADLDIEKLLEGLSYDLNRGQTSIWEESSDVPASSMTSEDVPASSMTSEDVPASSMTSEDVPASSVASEEVS